MTENYLAWRPSVTRWLAFAVVVLDVAESKYWLLQAHGQPIFALAGLVGVMCINNGNVPALGLRLEPYQGWGHWFRVGCWFGIAIVVLAAICSLVWFVNGWPIPLYSAPPTVMNLFWMCMLAPFSEEIAFRVLLTVALASTLGNRGTILASGILFGLIHALGGNPGPDNLIAGFMLEWAFLRSGTILVPIAMHAAGNLLAFSLHTATWYWQLTGAS